MSKKNSIVLDHKDCLSKFEQISNIYLNFKKKITKFKTNKFLVTVSGGPDSLALAAMCKVYELNNKKKKFYYIHVNHAIRKNSYAESKYVKKILKKQNISLKIVNNKTKIINNIQHNARKVRYAFFNEECKKKKIKLILTAHHQDDQIETFLIRLSRGSGVQGLSAMNMTSFLGGKIKIFRPFLTESKKKLILITKKVFGVYVKDPSNNNKKFLRSNIRKIIPVLKKYGINNNQIIRSINNLRSSSKTINIYFKEVFKKIVKKKGKKISIKKKDLYSLNEELQIRILGSVLKSLNKSEYPPRSKKILTALQFLNSSRETKHQLARCLLVNRNNHLYIEKS